MKDNRIKQHIAVIKQIQRMTEEQLDVFMKEFITGLSHWNFDMNNLAIFMQLLLQMDPRLAERFIEEMAEKDKE